MLEGAKAYAAGIGAVVVLALVGYFLYSYHSSQEEVKKNAGTIAVQKEVIKGQADTLEIQDKSGKATEQVQSDRAAQGKVIDQSFDKVKRDEQAKIDAIHNQPQVTPIPGAAPVEPVALPPGVTQQDAQVSAVRIDALWESYCLAAPAADGCKKS